jgi:hypothetical protein
MSPKANPRFAVRATRWFVHAALVVWTQPSMAQAWIQWSSAVGGNDHYYALTPYATNWTAAEKLAVSWGGTLATITSASEQDFINDTFLTGVFEHRPVWIGLHDPAAKGTLAGLLRQVQEQFGNRRPGIFQWVTGERLSYTNWKRGEPSNSPPGEYYVAMNWEYSDSPPRGAKGDWNDAPFNGTTGYGGSTSGPYFGLVERETDPTKPVPRSLAGLALPVALAALVLAVLVGWLIRSKRRKEQAA